MGPVIIMIITLISFIIIKCRRRNACDLSIEMGNVYRGSETLDNDEISAEDVEILNVRKRSLKSE